MERLVVPTGRGDDGDTGLPGDPGQRADVASHAPAGQLDDQGEAVLLAQCDEFGGHGRRVAFRSEDGRAVAHPVQVEDEVLVGEGGAAHRSGTGLLR
ncbi:hypothetical protein SGRI78S_05928 [Streptomyces griseus subsp. griseus]